MRAALLLALDAKSRLNEEEVVWETAVRGV